MEEKTLQEFVDESGLKKILDSIKEFEEKHPFVHFARYGENSFCTLDRAGLKPDYVSEQEQLEKATDTEKVDSYKLNLPELKQFFSRIREDQQGIWICVDLGEGYPDINSHGFLITNQKGTSVNLRKHFVSEFIKDVINKL